MAIMTQVAVLFLLIIVGFLARKFKVVTEVMNDQVVSLITKVTLPAFLITSMNYEFSKEALLESMNFLLISVVIYFGIIICSFVVVKLLRVPLSKVDVYQYALTFSNVGFMGYPVISLVYGSKGVFYAAIYNLPFNILIWTYGIYLLTRHHQDVVALSFGQKLKQILNPGVLSIIVGFAIFLTSFQIPVPIRETLSLIGGMTTPLSMMFIGFLLSEIKIVELINNAKDYIIVFFRLIITPFVVFIILSFVGLKGHVLGIPVLITAMPVAANAAVFSSMYGADSKLASKLIFISTLLSVFTVPLFMLILG